MPSDSPGDSTSTGQPHLSAIFLSAVTSEFSTHRSLLKADLSLPTIKVQEQEDLVGGGGKLLATLDLYLRDGCDAVIHLVGHKSGAAVKQDEIRWLLETYPDFSERFSDLADELKQAPPDLTYTQLEAFLALYHRKRCHCYVRSDLRQTPLPPGDCQQRHLDRLRILGEHRQYFDDEQHLCRLVLRDLQNLLPWRVRSVVLFREFPFVFLAGCLLLICILLGGIWNALLQPPPAKGVAENQSPTTNGTSVLFTGEFSDDIERLEGAGVHDVVDLARECSHPLWPHLADRFDQQPDVLLRVVQVFRDVQSGDSESVLLVTDGEQTQLKQAEPRTIVKLASMSQNGFIRKLASVFSDEPDTLLAILMEFCS
ncbi:MAG: hypothetical protein KDA85_19440 [Planctomycetaceae bacterium]|nr:hypothetical protein [Planctomycetaceae bacterium]